ncbi:hypothetical protein [Ligilactobacillus salitolerans]|nr:hypothetical protein [Ligilactobacillus salitolerans]
MDSKYGYGWGQNKKACADPKLMLCQLWIKQHDDSSVSAFFESELNRKIYDLRMAGEGQKYISEMLDINMSLVHGRLNYLKRNKLLDDAPPIINRRNFNIKIEMPPRDEIESLIASGVVYQSLAKKYEVSRTTIATWVTRYGLDDLAETVRRQKLTYVVIYQGKTREYRTADECSATLNFTKSKIHKIKAKKDGWRGMRILSGFDYRREMQKV